MKTSNKILIGLLAVVFLVPACFVFAVNYKLSKGLLVADKPDDNSHVVAPYRVLRVNGNNRSAVYVYSSGESKIALAKEEAHPVQYNLQHDTLLVQFAASQSKYSSVSIHIPGEVQDICTDSAQLYYQYAAGKPNPHFYLVNSVFNLMRNGKNGVSFGTDSLDITARGKSEVYFDDDIKVNYLFTRLFDFSRLRVNKQVQHLQLEAGDSTTVEALGFQLKK